MKNLLTLIIVLNTVFAFGQEKNYKEAIGFLEFEKRVNSGQTSFSNMIIDLNQNTEYTKRNEKKNDVVYSGQDYDIYYDDYGEEDGYQRKTLKVKYEYLAFSNCKIAGILRFKKSSSRTEGPMYNGLQFSSCELNTLEVINENIRQFNVTENTTWESIYISDCPSIQISIQSLNIANSGTSSIILTNNIIEGFDLSTNVNRIDINNNVFINEVNIVHSAISDLNFSNNQIQIDSNFIDEKPGYYLSRKFNSTKIIFQSIVEMSNSNIENVKISRNAFSFKKVPYLEKNTINYDFSNSVIATLKMENEILNKINFNHTLFTQIFEIDSVVLNSFSAINTEFPNNNFDVSWDIFKNKLVFFLTDSTSFSPIDSLQLSNKKLYTKYISILNHCFTLFKSKGDLESANACYIEMKDVETRRLHYLYKTEGGTKNYLNYNLNRFLKFFAEYGTSPVRSVQISGWVILIFGFFYFFFYSEWDKINRKFLITKSELSCPEIGLH